jgi:hypothetical protein
MDDVIYTEAHYFKQADQDFIFSPNLKSLKVANSIFCGQSFYSFLKTIGKCTNLETLVLDKISYFNNDYTDNEED